MATENGHVVILTGIKKLVEFAESADYLLVSARNVDADCLFLLPRNAPGVQATLQRSLDPTRRFGEVEFAVNSSGEDLFELDGSEDGIDLNRLESLGILLQSAETLGAAERAFDMTMEWVTNRFAFGRPIGSYQVLKHRLAEHKLWLESARGLVTGLAEALQSHPESSYELASATKAYIGAGSVALVQDAIQMHGGIGVTWEHDLHLILRRVTSNRTQYGTPTDHLYKLGSLQEA